jgi:hypothetical protein
VAQDGESTETTGEACERLARDPAPERRLDAIRAALADWRVADEARRAFLDAFMLSVAHSLDFFACVELADMLSGFGAVPQSLAGLLAADPSTEAVLAGVGAAPPAGGGELPFPAKPLSMERVVDLAMSGAFDDLAQALSRRSARPLGAVKTLLSEPNAAKLGTLVRQAGYGRTLLAAIARGLERQGRKADLLTMMIAYENAKGASAHIAPSAHIAASAPVRAAAR